MSPLSLALTNVKKVFHFIPFVFFLFLTMAVVALTYPDGPLPSDDIHENPFRERNIKKKISDIERMR